VTGDLASFELFMQLEQSLDEMLREICRPKEIRAVYIHTAPPIFG
jgi:hypothetical protein